MKTAQSLYQVAQRYIPGGVNSPVRAFQHIAQEPVFIDHAQGPFLFDTEQNRYIDYVNSWGPLITGHADPLVIQAVENQLAKGLTYGAPTELETQMASLLCQLVPSLEMVRMVNSGTEATMSAIRLARGYTKRDQIVKFIGCYHGHVDALLVAAGSGALTQGQPSSAGIPLNVVQHTLILPYNDCDALKKLFNQQGEQIAAVIIEPVAGNMSCVPAQSSFLQHLRQLCDQYGSLLIFDEVMSGFRVALGGAQALYNIRPDLTCLGKIIGGGMPVGAFGGRAEIMRQIAPLGPVYQAGTLAGNPLAMAAGLAVLQQIQSPGFYERLTAHTNQLALGLQQKAQAHQIPLFVHQVGGMLGIFFSAQQTIDNYLDVAATEQNQFYQFFQFMLAEKIYLAPSPFEALFVSSVHDTTTLAQTLAAAEKAFAQLSITKQKPITITEN